MKRMIRALVAAAVLVSSLTVSAFAATDGYTTDVSGTVTCDGEKYTATYTGAEAGEQYVLLVVEGTPESYTVTQGSILYINQTAADANGTVTFSGFIPMNVADSVVLLGGYFADGSPKVLGTIVSQSTPGDVNEDDKINIKDSVLLLRVVAGLEEVSGNAAKAADVNGDGKVNIKDSVLLLRVVAGLEEL